MYVLTSSGFLSPFSNDCSVGAGSSLALVLGLLAWSCVFRWLCLAAGGFAVYSASNDCLILLRFISSSWRACLSALTERLAKTYAPPPAGVYQSQS